MPPDKQEVGISGVEHCEELYRRDVFVDGVGGQSVERAAYLKFAAEPIDLDAFAPENSIIVPSQVRASSVVRQIRVRCSSLFRRTLCWRKWWQ